MQPRGRLCARVARLLARAGDAVTARSVELLAAAAAVALYLPSIRYGFVFDDLALIGADGAPVPLGGAIPYRPLRYASYALDAWLGGSAPVYHLHNVLLHGLVAWLVVALARRLGAGAWPALVAGLLVAVHPVSVEAAAYVSGRRDLLCVALGLAAVHAHLSARVATSLVLFVLAVAAKESALVFAAPLVAASLACPFAASGPPGSGGERERRGSSLGALAIAVAAAIALAVVYGAVGPWAPAAGAASWAMPGHVILHYLGSLAGTHALAPEYPSLLEAASRLARGDGRALACGLSIGALVGAAAVAAFAACTASSPEAEPRTSSRRFALAWTTSVLLALGIWGGLHEPGADRHAYLLLPALGILVALVLPDRLDARPPAWRACSTRRDDRRLPRSRKVAYAIATGAPAVAAALLLAQAAAATHAQMPVWKSERTLWVHAVAHAPSSPRAHANLARVDAADGAWRDAVAHLNAAVRADGGDPLFFVARAAVRCAEGRTSLVRRDLRRALERGADPSPVRALARDCDVRWPLGRPEASRS